MFLKLLLVTVILVAFTMLAMGVKLFFNKDAEFTKHACAMEDGELDKVGGCAGCELKEIADCSEKEH